MVIFAVSLVMYLEEIKEFFMRMDGRLYYGFRFCRTAANVSDKLAYFIMVLLIAVLCSNKDRSFAPYCQSFVALGHNAHLMMDFPHANWNSAKKNVTGNQSSKNLFIQSLQ